MTRRDPAAAAYALALATWQQARAARLGADVHFNATSDARTIPWDCELGRLCKGRLETREYVLWGYAHDAAGGSGKITRNDLFTAVSQLGITTCRRTFNDWLHKGMGIYWRERGGYLYLTSWKKLARKHTKWAAQQRPELVSTNLPGQQRVRLDLTGSLQSVHAKLYGGWLTVKAAKNGYLDISRYTLTALWSASKRALLGYEKLLGIRVEERYAESADIHNPLIPAYAYLCLDTNGHDFASWQLSNRYYPTSIEIHPANGQRRKVRKACNGVFDTPNPAAIRRGGGCRIERIGRITFYGKYGKKGYIPAAKQLDRHLRKHGDVWQRPHYIYLTTRYGKRIYECSTGACWRSADDGRDRVGEGAADFQRRRMGYSISWARRMGVGDKRL